jgi:death-on-curing protein
MRLSQLTLFSADTVIQLHSSILTQTGGTDGLRDLDALETVLRRPVHVVNGHLVLPSLALMAASLVTGIVRDRPFVDGNKRTAMSAGCLFILNNKDPAPFTQGVWMQVLVDLEQGEIGLEDLAAHYHKILGDGCPIELDNPVVRLR